MSRLSILTIFAMLLVHVPSEAQRRPPASRPVLMPLGSAWEGTASNDERHVNAKDVAAKLHIDQREGNTFVARYVLPKRSLRLRGQINNQGVFVARVTEVLQGKFPAGTDEVEWNGQVTEREMAFQYAFRPDQVVTVTLRLIGQTSRRGSSG
jgi:hypothetical protein